MLKLVILENFKHVNILYYDMTIIIIMILWFIEWLNILFNTIFT